MKSLKTGKITYKGNVFACEQHKVSCHIGDHPVLLCGFNQELIGYKILSDLSFLAATIHS